ncbi:MAG: hypothetical protein ACRDTF_24140 [Pseudonocardiaceae bacterium]
MTSGVPDVVNRVLRLANEVHGLASSCGRDDLSALLADPASRHGPRSAWGCVRREENRFVQRIRYLPERARNALG